MERVKKLVAMGFTPNSGDSRLFWIIVFIISTWNMSTIFIVMIKSFFADLVTIEIETTYLRWNNTFPSVSVCLMKGKHHTELLNFLKTIEVEEDVLLSKNIRTIYNYMFANPNLINVKESSCKGLNSSCGVNIQYIKKMLLPTTCELIMMNVTFLNKPISNCEDIFKFHELGMGYCFLANNIADYGLQSNLPLRFASSAPERSLQLLLKENMFWSYELYIHSPEDLPYFNSKIIQVTNSFLYSYNIEEVYNDIIFVDGQYEQRKCKFPSEILHSSTYHYSFSTCMIDLQIHMELKLCNCTLYTAPYRYFDFYCTFEGSICLIKGAVSAKVMELVSAKYLCFPSCIEQQITHVRSSNPNSIATDGSIYLEIDLLNTPYLRYKRVSTQTQLDLVVSTGGLIGLVIGASFLNLAELFYTLYIKVLSN